MANKTKPAFVGSTLHARLNKNGSMYLPKKAQNWLQSGWWNRGLRAGRTVSIFCFENEHAVHYAEIYLMAEDWDKSNEGRKDDKAEGMKHG